MSNNGNIQYYRVYSIYQNGWKPPPVMMYLKRGENVLYVASSETYYMQRWRCVVQHIMIMLKLLKRKHKHVKTWTRLKADLFSATYIDGGSVDYCLAIQERDRFDPAAWEYPGFIIGTEHGVVRYSSYSLKKEGQWYRSFEQAFKAEVVDPPATLEKSIKMNKRPRTAWAIERAAEIRQQVKHQIYMDDLSKGLY